MGEFRKALGGGMRQAGVLAASGLIALESMPSRLAGDHENAKTLGEGLTNLGMSGASVETNIVLFSLTDEMGDPKAFVQQCAAPSPHDGTCSVLMCFEDRYGWIRAVLHHQVSAVDVQLALARSSEI